MADRTSVEVRLTDDQFMEVIRDFPGVYDKNSEVFKDKTRKEEDWEKISETLNVRIEDAKRRYETIRTRLSRHLKKVKEGYWSLDSKDVKLQFLHWLVPYIKTREAPFQSKHDIKEDPSSFVYDENDGEQLMRRNEDVESSYGSSSHHNMDEHNNGDGEQGVDVNVSDVTRVSMIPIGDVKNDANIEEDDDSCLPIVTSVSSTVADFEINGGSRKRKYPPYTFIKTPTLSGDSVKSHNTERQNDVMGRKAVYDEDEHYCLSLIGRLKKLDSKKKAYLRSTVEKLFLDFELGYVQFPQQKSGSAQPM